jgi:hypothetical protein
MSVPGRDTRCLRQADEKNLIGHMAGLGRPKWCVVWLKEKRKLSARPYLPNAAPCNSSILSLDQADLLYLRECTIVQRESSVSHRGLVFVPRL